MTVLLGGIDLPITKLDGSTESVKVLQLPIRRMGDYLAAIEDESKLVELFTAKEPGWSDTLSDESFVAIITKGEELNADFFFPWCARRLNRSQRLSALLPQSPSPSGTLPTGSPKSPLTAA